MHHSRRRKAERVKKREMVETGEVLHGAKTQGQLRWPLDAESMKKGAPNGRRGKG